uniref:F-box domain-containing protein n=1 Tax=Kalanchoe fedtschenkoi TaxID=63787 RepID=A0A7N0TT16_KALFE
MVTTATRVGPSPHFLAGLGSCSFSNSSLCGMRKPAAQGKMIGMKRKRERDSWDEDGEGSQQDPLEVFGSDIMMMILSHLDARSVALSLLVSRAWHGVASSDRLWTSKCEELWHGKAHIPRMSQMRGLSKLAAYSISVMDGKRARITRDDLCDHAWYFHFNKAVPEYWLNLDPSWKGTGPPMRRYFHPDGSQTADQDDKVWGGHESCYSVVTGIVGESKIRSHYVRINRWPSMVVARKDDWSWAMSNHLYSYSSIPDADKEGGTGPY